MDWRLDTAVDLGDLERVKELIEHEDVEPDEHVLQEAIRDGNAAITCYLYKAGLQSEVNIFELAAYYSKLELVKELDGMLEEEPTTGALIEAAECGNLNLVRYLVEEAGVEPEEIVVEHAMMEDNGKVIKYLVEDRGVQLSCYSIHTATLLKRKDLVEYLTEQRDKYRNVIN